MIGFLKGLTLAMPLLSMVGCIGGYTPLSVQVVDNQFVANGVIDGSTPRVLRDAIEQNNSVKTLVLAGVPGSVDDEANLAIARHIRNAGLNTIVPANGLVASGGTDLFLAGVERTIEPGACIGVHSWGLPTLTGIRSGSELSRDDPRHQAYLSYYDEMNIPQEFYWFTLEAAPISDAYFMTYEEINSFQMTTQPMLEGTDETLEERYERCLTRLDAADQ